MALISTLQTQHSWLVIPIVVLGITSLAHGAYHPMLGATLDKPHSFTGRTTDTLHADALLAEGEGSDPDGVRRIQDNRNRTYDPKHGRWLQRDPIGYADGMNLYEYVKSRPGIHVDPLGLRVTAKCGPELWKFLREHQIDMRRLSGSTSTEGGLGENWVTLAFEYGVGPKHIGGENEIVHQMIWVNHNFVLENGLVEDWEKHIDYRLNVIAAARSLKIRFDWKQFDPDHWEYNGLVKRNNHWYYVDANGIALMTFETSAYHAVADLWDSDAAGSYSLMCEDAAVMVLARGLSLTVGKTEFNKTVADAPTLWTVQATGRNLWYVSGVDAWDETVPGDWMYLDKPSGKGVEAGENLIYLGNMEFWGHGPWDRGWQLIRSKDEWIDAVTRFEPVGEQPKLRAYRRMIPVGLRGR